MKIAVSATGKGISASIDPRFGRAGYFVIVDADSVQVVDVIDNSIAQNAAHGAGINAATMIVEAGVDSVITGKVGPKAYAVLEAAGIKVIPDCSGTVLDAVEQFKSGTARSADGPTENAHPGRPAGQAGGAGGGMCRRRDMGQGGGGRCGGGFGRRK
ncbi:MAG TPA: dinitrogenase iron-molybdenum cofactor biosynthesis protein [Thermodesulfobacteriaceae bacterium]|nr:dinitrogenase iron-molybdenum cofactor biosynthesis protein [Thermodesulfobacteriaceae bacterium]